MKRTKKKRVETKEGPSRPSNFFLIALALGLIFLAMLFIIRVSTSAPAAPASRPAEQR